MMSALELTASHSPVCLLTFDKTLASAAEEEGLVGLYGYDVDTDSFIAELTARGLWVPALP
jgi:hypothetical protein